MIWLPGLLENMSLLQVSVQPAFSFSVLWPAGWVTAGSHVKGFMLSLRTLAQMRSGWAEKCPHSYPSTVSYKAKEVCLSVRKDRDAPGMQFSNLLCQRSWLYWFKCQTTVFNTFFPPQWFIIFISQCIIGGWGRGAKNCVFIWNKLFSHRSPCSASVKVCGILVHPWKRGCCKWTLMWIGISVDAKRPQSKTKPKMEDHHHWSWATLLQKQIKTVQPFHHEAFQKLGSKRSIIRYKTSKELVKNLSNSIW